MWSHPHSWRCAQAQHQTWGAGLLCLAPVEYLLYLATHLQYKYICYSEEQALKSTRRDHSPIKIFFQHCRAAGAFREKFFSQLSIPARGVMISPQADKVLVPPSAMGHEPPFKAGSCLGCPWAMQAWREVESSHPCSWDLGAIFGVFARGSHSTM